VALQKRRMLSSMQMNHAIPRKAAAAMEDDRLVKSAVSLCIRSRVENMMAGMRKVLVWWL
jgi:hypothetical protein